MSNKARAIDAIGGSDVAAIRHENQYKTALRESVGVNTQAERIVHGCKKPKPATWRDTRALAANDKELTHAA